MANAAVSKPHRQREYNPVLLKELRGRMRGARGFVVLTIYLLLLTCFASIVYSAFSQTVGMAGSGATMAQAGTILFSSVVLVEIFLVAFITPAFAASAITGERERQTYELLRTTLLPAHRLVLGKLGATLTYVSLLILAAIPLEGLAFMFGGVVIEELLLALIILAVTAITFSSMGLFFSAHLRSTVAATVFSYATVILLSIGVPVMVLLPLSLFGSAGLLLSGSSPAPPPFVQAVLIYLAYGIGSLSPVVATVATKLILDSEGSIWGFWTPLYSTSGAPLSTRIPIPSGWIVYIVLYLALSFLLLALTIRRVRRQETR